MPDTSVTISLDGTPLSADDAALIQSVHIEQGMNSRDMASLVVSLTHDDRSSWTSPLDSLVATSATPFRVRLARARDGGAGRGSAPQTDSVTVEAYSSSASWQITPGHLSTLTVAGIDASVLLDREEQTAPQEGTDSAVVSSILSRNGLTPGTITTTTSTDASFSPQQRSTDWAFLQELARRNGFDVWVQFNGDTPVWNFDRVNPTGPSQGTLDLAYGALGGSPSAEVQLLAGRTVHVSRLVPGTTNTDEASDDGTGSAMGDRPLGGWQSVRADHTDVAGEQDAATTARALAETWSFGATLSVSLDGPRMPLVHPRRTIDVQGVGPILSGTWLVKTVSHTVTAGGHQQQVTLTRNALGSSAGAAGALGGLAAAVGL